jgi:uncharacterized SAM-binding protein YcdF (DUF218 family)
VAGFIASKIVTLLVLPPGGPILIMLLGLCLLRRFRMFSVFVVAFGLLILYACSIPLVSNSIRSRSDKDVVVVSQADLDSAAAIVILGAGLYVDAPEYGEDTISGSALERVRYGAFLHRATGKPLLVTGGRPSNTTLSEAEAMQKTLEKEFGIVVRWIEDRSLNTRDNADYSRMILEAEGIEKILLVTHAYHMPRARKEFERAGFDVLPAPTKFRAEQSVSYFDFLPSAGALNSTAHSLREWLGLAWYGISH